MKQILDDEEQERLASELAELMKMESEIHQEATKYTKLTASELSGIRDSIKKWLKKALEIAHEFKPAEFSIATDVGIPPRVHISFSWLLSSDSETESEE